MSFTFSAEETHFVKDNVIDADSFHEISWLVADVAQGFKRIITLNELGFVSSMIIVWSALTVIFWDIKFGTDLEILRLVNRKATIRIIKGPNETPSNMYPYGNSRNILNLQEWDFIGENTKKTFHVYFTLWNPYNLLFIYHFIV